MCNSLSIFQFSSVAQSCTTVCDPMNCSMPGLPVHHQLPESTQTHVHWVGDAIQSSHPLSPLLLLPSIFPSIRVFSNESAPQSLIKTQANMKLGESAGALESPVLTGWGKQAPSRSCYLTALLCSDAKCLVQITVNLPLLKRQKQQDWDQGWSDPLGP